MCGKHNSSDISDDAVQDLTRHSNNHLLGTSSKKDIGLLERMARLASHSIETPRINFASAIVMICGRCWVKLLLYTVDRLLRPPRH